MVTFKKNRN